MSLLLFNVIREESLKSFNGAIHKEIRVHKEIAKLSCKA